MELNQTIYDDFKWNPNHFYLLQSIYAISMFLGCFICYLIPVKLIEKHKRIQSLLNNDLKMKQNLDEGMIEDDVLIQSNANLDEENFEKIMKNCNSIGAGIFVSICFLGLMPVVKNEFSRYYRSANILNVDYPVAEFATLMGFFLVLFLEELVMMCRKWNQRKQPPVLYLDDDVHDPLLSEDTDHHHELQQSSSKSSSSRDPFEEIKFNDDDELKTGHVHSNHDHRSKHGTRNNTSIEIKTPNPCKDGQRNHSLNYEDNHNHSHIHSHSSLFNESGLTFFILMFAMR